MIFEDLLADLERILGEKAKAPFNASGPRGDIHAIGSADVPGHHGTRRGNLDPHGWDCHCVNYDCSCKGKGKHAGQHKHFVVKRGYKANYNSKYVAKYGSWKKRAHARKDVVKRAKAPESSPFKRAKVA